MLWVYQKLYPKSLFDTNTEDEYVGEVQGGKRKKRNSSALCVLTPSEAVTAIC